MPSTDAVRANDDIEIIINSNGDFIHSAGKFMAGPYANAGFSFIHIPYTQNLGTHRLYCNESQKKITKGIFCKQVIGLQGEPLDGKVAWFYAM